MFEMIFSPCKRKIPLQNCNDSNLNPVPSRYDPDDLDKLTYLDSWITKGFLTHFTPGYFERAISQGSLQERRAGGDGNHDHETWSGLEPCKVPLGHVR